MVVGRIRQVVALCSVNSIKYYLGGLVYGRFGEVAVLKVIFKTGSTGSLK